MPRKASNPIPVIDLFAGPGGLAEGFSSVLDAKGKKRRFDIRLSIEMDAYAHRTLSLRAFFRQFDPGQAPDEYYAYLRGEITGEELRSDPKFSKQWAEAEEEARCLELGVHDVTSIIGERLSGAKEWVLIGGPPCQAYSLVGRSRMTGAGEQREDESDRAYQQRIAQKKKAFEKDHRHQLYREYLKIIADHRPTMFVMENVKGILSSKQNGQRIFPLIRSDLEKPLKALGRSEGDLGYTIHSLVTPPKGLFANDYEDSDFLIRAEEHGIPQARHRVILLGIRNDLPTESIPLLEKSSKQMSLKKALSGLPRLISGLSKGGEDTSYEALQQFRNSDVWNELLFSGSAGTLIDRMERHLQKAGKNLGRRGSGKSIRRAPHYASSVGDEGRLVVCNHDTRSHIREDLWRYFFAACFAEENGYPPKLENFPRSLLPKHRNVDQAIAGKKFADRFRVQLPDRPSTTVVSHISKDGHYYIHPDPQQYRSLTVREAARLQTFPDNYFFEGPRTQQFHQVGNAVPPLLARKIAKVVVKLLAKE